MCDIFVLLMLKHTLLFDWYSCLQTAVNSLILLNLTHMYTATIYSLRSIAYFIKSASTISSVRQATSQNFVLHLILYNNKNNSFCVLWTSIYSLVNITFIRLAVGREMPTYTRHYFVSRLSLTTSVIWTNWMENIG